MREEIRTARLLALWYTGLCLVACFIWFFLWVAFYLMTAYILIAAGVPMPGMRTFAFIGVGIQVGLMPVLARRKEPRWTFETSADRSEIVLIPPEHQHKLAIWDQDHDFSFLRTLAAIFLAAPVLLVHAWQSLRRVRELKRLDIDPAVRLAADLVREQKKITMLELRESWRESSLLDALEAARVLPGFQFFSAAPQGVALTHSAIEELLE